MNGVEKYVTETTETIEDEEHRALGKPIAKARPRMKSTITLTPVSVPLRERKWVDVNPESYDHECYVISKAMIRLLRHDQNDFSGNPTEQSNMMILLKNSTRREKEYFRWCFAMVTQRLDFYSGKRRRSQEKVSILFEP